MEQLIENLRKVLLIICAAAGLVAFVWLLILGQFWAIAYGFAALAAPFMLIVLSIPGSYLTIPALSYMDKGQPQVALALIGAAKLYEWFIFTGWFTLVFVILLSHTLTENYLALLIWAYCVALSPWLYMAGSLRNREIGGDSTRIFILSAHCAYLAIAIMICCGWFAPLNYIMVFGTIMFAGSLSGTIFAYNWHRSVSATNAAKAKPPETPNPR